MTTLLVSSIESIELHNQKFNSSDILELKKNPPWKYSTNDLLLTYWKIHTLESSKERQFGFEIIALKNVCQFFLECS